jgi:hypothetical protein
VEGQDYGTWAARSSASCAADAHDLATVLGHQSYFTLLAEVRGCACDLPAAPSFMSWQRWGPDWAMARAQRAVCVMCGRCP